MKYKTLLKYPVELGGDTVILELSKKSLDWYNEQHFWDYPFSKGKHLHVTVKVLEEIPESMNDLVEKTFEELQK